MSRLIRFSIFATAGLLGFAVAGILGLFAGFLFVYLGYQLRPALVSRSEDQSRELILILMELSGKLASADGYVSVEEISFTESAIQELQESYDFTRSEAIEHFNRGKADDYPINERLNVLNQYLTRATTILCLQLLVRLAAADNRLSTNEIAFLRFVGGHLRIQPAVLESFLQQILSFQDTDTRNYSSHHSDYRDQTNRRPIGAEQTLKKAYNTLGVEPDSSNDEIKRSYRKLRSLYHPDKLQAKKIPQALIEEAERQIIEVNKAWDVVKKARNL